MICMDDTKTDGLELNTPRHADVHATEDVRAVQSSASSCFLSFKLAFPDLHYPKR